MVHSENLVADIVDPILERGYEIQAHFYTEWLEWSSNSPAGNRRKRIIGDVSADDQRVLISNARDMLVRPGAPMPIAFRAENYKADDRTIAALAELNFLWDAMLKADYFDHIINVQLR